MNFFFMLNFEQELEQRNTIEQALLDTLEKHLLLRCNFVGDKKHSYQQAYWKAIDDWKSKTVLILHDNHFAKDFHPDALHPSHNLGVCLHMSKHSPKQLLVQFDHCRVDGRGSHTFLKDFFSNYQKINLLDISHNSNDYKKQWLELSNRNHFSVRKNFLYCQYMDFIRVIKFFVCFFKNSEIQDQDENINKSSHQLNYNQYKVLSLPSDKLRTIQKGFKATQTLNDWVLAQLFISLKSVFFHTKEDSNCNLRVMIPIDMRERKQKKFIAANIVSSVFIDRSIKSIGENKNFYHSISNELSKIKKYRNGFALLYAYSFVFRFPKYIDSFLKLTKPNSFSSTIYTNLGTLFNHKVMYLGHNKLEKIEVLAPIFSGTNLAICQLNYNGITTLTCHYNQNKISDTKAAKFLNLLESKLLTN